MLDLLIASLLGVIASMLAWFVVTHSLRPRLDVSEFISRTFNSDGSAKFRVKIRNSRRTRNLTDLDVRAYASLPGYFPDRPDNRKVLDLSLTSNELIGMRPNDNRILAFDLTAALEAVRNDHGIGVDATDPNALHRLLNVGSGAGEVRVWTAFTDGYSGVRRTVFRCYAAADILDRHFHPVEVGPGRPTSAPTPPDAETPEEETETLSD